MKSQFESDAERFSELCICSFDEAWAIIGLCHDYAYEEESAYWQNIRQAVSICQSSERQATVWNTLPIIRKAFEARNQLPDTGGECGIIKGK